MIVDFSLSTVIFAIANFDKRKFFLDTLYVYFIVHIELPRIIDNPFFISLLPLARAGIIGFVLVALDFKLT